MKTVFKKSNLPFLKGTLHHGKGRDFWTLTRMMQEKNGLQHQLPAEIALLTRAAGDGDAWGRCELARTYFHHCGDLFLPSALRLWKQAAAENDGGALFDLKNLPIRERILAYRSPDGNGYADIEMKCALLTEWHLSACGLSPFETLGRSEQKRRCEALVRDVTPILQIPDTRLETIPQLSLNGMTVDGLAHWEGKISVREEVFGDVERLIEVIFHELGHIVAFAILRGGEHGRTLQELYGISDERVRSWQQNEMGYEVPTGEEDPDTLSYGVYTLWATFFCGLA